MVDQTSERKKDISLKNPAVFTGKKEDIERFVRSVKNYLLFYKDDFKSEVHQVLWILSYIEGNDADHWKREWEKSIEGKAYPTVEDFLKELEKHFTAVDKPGDALHKLKTEKMQKDKTAEHFVDQFKSYVRDSGITDSISIIDYFSNALPIRLQEKILNSEVPPSTTNGWYTKAIALDTSYKRGHALLKFRKEQDGRKPSQNNYNQRFRHAFNRQTQPAPDPNAMDVDRAQIRNNRLSDEQVAKYRQEGRCFRCDQLGHISRACPKKPQGNSFPFNTNRPQQTSARQAALDVKAIIQSMEKEEQDNFFSTLEQEDF